ncbi:CidA/LrgA family protein [Ferrimonas balearica]|uniref:CidA/LrgA family protein n=1 Tax=Ferrimonas balearica TaxID=44012 RepID=UPI001C99EC72|nr:CidA/LrgA family protein [Ferrimonas balearica]MBY5992872.1 CidA/LrgA family protein [Ferrimonas balearica]
MELLFGLATLIGLWLLGEALAQWLSLPIPGSVLGMAALFLFLLLRGGEPKAITVASDGLLKYLALLFVPAGVGVMVYGDDLLAAWLPATVAVVVATLVTLAVSAAVMALAMRLGARR